MYYAIDCETTGLSFKKDKLLGIGYFRPDESGYLTEPSAIKTWLEKHKDDDFIFQNGKFDQKFIAVSQLSGLPRVSFDTMLAAYLDPAKPSSLSLGSLVEHYLGLPSWKESEFIENLEDKTEEEQATYCLTDCEYTYKLVTPLMQMLVDTEQLEFFNKFLMPVSNLIAKM